MRNLRRYVFGASLLLLAAHTASANEGFVKTNCAKLGLGIHQKVERYESRDGSEKLVVYSLSCGVKLEAHGERTLQGSHSASAAYDGLRHWGYIAYTPTPQSVTRRAVENDQKPLGTWNTRASGRNNLVVLHDEPKVVNGNWSFCSETTRGACRDQSPEQVIVESGRESRVSRP